ncbi:MAG: VCBS repeat-containing protein [Candidatus Aminicenantes bacterium]|nr:VCBS repeat-containing protein [Candidatus Aminicenantes bacterium]
MKTKGQFLFFLCLSTGMMISALLAFSRTPYKQVTLSLPEPMKDVPLEGHFFLEDLNEDGRLDIVLCLANDLLLSIQKPDGEFSTFETLTIPLAGGFDFGSVLPGIEKQILVQHQQGISFFQKTENRWDVHPVPLVQCPTSFPNKKSPVLQRERFAFDLNGDGTAELMVWNKEKIHFYFQESSGNYILRRSFSLGTLSGMSYPGVRLVSSPLDWLIPDSRPLLMKPDWPEKLRYVTYSLEFGTDRALVSDFNHDGKKDFIHIISTEVRDKKSGGLKAVHEYRVYFLQKNDHFSEQPDCVARDPLGILASPHAFDVEGDGFPDLVRYTVKIKEGILRKPKTTLSLYLLSSYDFFSNEPSQVIEASGVPLSPETVVDVTGDGKKDLVLISSQTKGFSLGNVIGKFVERGITVFIRILPFDGKGFSRDSMLQTKIKLKFSMGIPLSLAGDYNGDGKKDLLAVDENRTRIFFFKEGEGFSGRADMNFSQKNTGAYRIEDLDQNGRSDILLFNRDKLLIYLFGPLKPIEN